MNKISYIAILVLLGQINLWAQDCAHTIEGTIIDAVSRTPLEFVNIYVQEMSAGTITDQQGNFKIEQVCSGEFHLNISHIGCEAIKMRIDILRDTTLTIELAHMPHALNTIVVEGLTSESINQASESVNRQTIEDNTNKNLGGLLEGQTGVHLIKNGTGIAKPVVQGLFGNRLTILNNGIVQSGQQWGNDHSPEIDPYAADKVIVLKGASNIEYGGVTLGSAVLVEPKPIEKEDHLHGQVNYSYETNGRGHNINTRLEQFSPIVAWRVNGTLKKYGDRRTPNYFLNNTGLEEANFSIQLEKSWSKRIFFNFYASTFNTIIGVLRGSHIGNLTDLEQALDRDIPFFTEPDFNYGIENPRQDVSHHLAKTQVKYFIDDHQVLDLVIAGQINDRKEFDVRRGDRDNRPALSLLQTSFHADLKYTKEFQEHWILKLGTQSIGTENDNVPGTGILPLVPDYRSWRTGAFGTLVFNEHRYQINLGARYDYEYQNVPTISRTLPREIVRFENNFHTFSALIAASFNVSSTQTIHLNSGFAMRPPGINELYSFGLHQGVSGIEEGDVNLQIERAFKNTIEYKWVPSSNFSINALAYHQHFKNYIYLDPQDEFRLTIRGAFPVFRYTQTDANIYGLDVSAQATISNSILGTIKYSYIRGHNISQDIPLIFIPPNSLNTRLIYRVKPFTQLGSKLKLEETEFAIESRFVFAQDDILEEQDFVAPPDQYHLLGLKFSTNIITPHNKIRFFVKADNVFDVEYRDYLNRQRYFADDLGRSITTGISFKF